MTRCGALFHGGFDPWRFCVRGGLVKDPTALCQWQLSLCCWWQRLQIWLLWSSVFYQHLVEIRFFKARCLQFSVSVHQKCLYFLSRQWDRCQIAAVSWIIQGMSADESDRGSVWIHYWLYKWLKAQRLILCVCFQYKADKSRADSDTVGSRGSSSRRLKPACCSFQRAGGRSHGPFIRLQWNIESAASKGPNFCSLTKALTRGSAIEESSV